MTQTPDQARAGLLKFIDADPEIAAKIFRKIVEEASDNQMLGMMEMAINYGWHFCKERAHEQALADPNYPW